MTRSLSMLHITLAFVVVLGAAGITGMKSALSKVRPVHAERCVAGVLMFTHDNRTNNWRPVVRESRNVGCR